MRPDTTERLHALLVEAYGADQPGQASQRRVMIAIAHVADHAVPRPSPRRLRLAMPAWRRGAAAMAASATLLMPSAAAVADADSLPGDLGHGVRHAVEQLWVGVTWGQADVQARRTVAARRLAEAQALLSISGPSDQVQALQAEARALVDGIAEEPRDQGADDARATGGGTEQAVAVDRPPGPHAQVGTPPGRGVEAAPMGQGNHADAPDPADADDVPRGSAHQTGRPGHEPTHPPAGPQVDHDEGSSGATAPDASAGDRAGTPATGGSRPQHPPSGQAPPALGDEHPAAGTAPAGGRADPAPPQSQAAAPEHPAPAPPAVAAPDPAPPAPAPPRVPPGAASTATPQAPSPASPEVPAGARGGVQAGPRGASAPSGPPG